MIPSSKCYHQNLLRGSDCVSAAHTGGFQLWYEFRDNA
jgi:hypothetical protein